MEEHKALLQSICEARGHIEFFVGDCFHKWFTSVNSIKSFETGDGYFLRGYLMEPETLKANFGDKPTCMLCGGTVREILETNTAHGHERDILCHKCGANWMDRAEFPEEGNLIPASEYAGRQMIGLSLKEMLEYYKENKQI